MRGDSRLPSVVCQTCRRILHDYANGIFTRKITIFNHSTITGSNVITRDHTCKVCDVGSSSGLRQYTSKIKPSVGRPPINDPKAEPSPIKLCSFCFSKLSPGNAHKCTQTTRENNILKEIIPKERSSEKIASAVLKNKLDKSKSKNDIIELSQKHGPRLHVKIQKRKYVNKDFLLCHDDMMAMKSRIGLSGRSTIEIARTLRSASKNRKIIKPGLKDVMSKEIHKLDSVFSTDKLRDSQIPLVYCNNITKCLEIIESERDICLGDAELKIGIDVGGGFLKVCLNVLTQDDFFPATKKRLCFGVDIAKKEMQSTSIRN